MSWPARTPNPYRCVLTPQNGTQGRKAGAGELDRRERQARIQQLERELGIGDSQ